MQCGTAKKTKKQQQAATTKLKKKLEIVRQRFTTLANSET